LTAAEQDTVVRAYQTLAVEQKLRDGVIVAQDSLYTT
jgi:hypothetical protein